MTLDLDAIEARVEAATEGPWTVGANAGCGCCRWIRQGDEDGPQICNADDRGDDQFIAHARTDVPALVAEVRRLREALGMPESDAPIGKQLKEKIPISTGDI